MPVNYKLGKIYKIISDQTKDIYIGSTCEPTLARRIFQHRVGYKRFLNGKSNYVTSYEILKYDDAQIILLENWPCNNKDELHQRERYWIENTQNYVNKYIPYKSVDEKKDFFKNYYTQNKKAYNEYYKDNKKKILRKVLCECGKKSTHLQLERHKKSKFHIKYELNEMNKKIKSTMDNINRFRFLLNL